MDPLIALVAVVAGYLLGSISFARLVARRVDRTVDVTHIVTEVGDGVTFTSDAVSATSVRMKLGKRYGLLVALLDMAKVAVPVLVLRLLYPGEPYLYLAAAAGVAGHNWPVYHRFQGGRGESDEFLHQREPPCSWMPAEGDVLRSWCAGRSVRSAAIWMLALTCERSQVADRNWMHRYGHWCAVAVARAM